MTAPAESLRAASERLRTLAGGATPGDLATCACGHHIDEHGDVAGCIRCECDLARQGVVAAAVARYAMSPPVTLAVADLLDEAYADWHREEHSLGAISVRSMSGATNDPDPRALAVARANQRRRPLMCGCEHHWNLDAPCTCVCSEHAEFREYGRAALLDSPDAEAAQSEGGVIDVAQGDGRATGDALIETAQQQVAEAATEAAEATS